jgi:hypothetical protein
MAFLAETCSPVHFVGDSDDGDHGVKTDCRSTPLRATRGDGAAHPGRARKSRSRSLLALARPAGVDELYDLRADPAELDNLAGPAETRAAQERLARRLLSHPRECGDAPAVSKLEIALAAQADGSGPPRPARR